jgi:sugar phosphate isomerase/epimerase
MELYLSLSAYGGVSTRQALTVFEQAGIRHVELAIGVRADDDAAIAVHDFCRQGIHFRAHHAFVWQAKHRPFNLAEPINVGYFQQMMDWLATRGITAYSVHPGHFSQNSERDMAWHQMLNNLETLQGMGQERGIELAVETMYTVPDDLNQHYLLDSLDSIRSLCAVIPSLKWVLDLSHLNIGWENRLQVIDAIADRLLEIHISDNNGRQDLHSRITAQTWWLPWRDRLPTHVPYVLETRLNRQSPPRIRAEYERVRSLLAQ